MGKALKNTFKFIFVGITILVYAVVLWRIFVGCDSSVTEQILLNDVSRPLFEEERENFIVRKINPSAETMDENGRVQVKYITALSYAGESELQFTVKYNIDYIYSYLAKNYPEVDFSGALLRFELEKSGVRYSEYESVEDERYDYYYIRCAFRGIDIGTSLDESGYECVTDEAELYVYANLPEGEEEELLMTITLFKNNDGYSNPNSLFLDTN